MSDNTTKWYLLIQGYDDAAPDDAAALKGGLEKIALPDDVTDEASARVAAERIWQERSRGGGKLARDGRRYPAHARLVLTIDLDFKLPEIAGIEATGLPVILEVDGIRSTAEALSALDIERARDILAINPQSRRRYRLVMDLMSFDAVTSTGEVRRAMESHGLRHADLRALLQFAAARPALVRHSPVIALGSFRYTTTSSGYWGDSGSQLPRRYPHIIRTDDGSYDLKLVKEKESWNKGTRFLVVRDAREDE